MDRSQLHGQKIGPFEQGYAAFLAGIRSEENPFNDSDTPYSQRQWGRGWVAAQREKLRHMP